VNILVLAGWISLVLLALGALGALYRIIAGPALLDRAIALDVLVIVLSCGLTVWMAIQGTTHFIVVVVVASLIGFISSAILARFTVEGAQANRSESRPKPRPSGSETS